jgi:glycogen operon protein
MSERSSAPAQAPSAEYSYRDRLLMVSRGSPLPAGAIPTPSGTNFVLISRHATAVWLVLSEPCDDSVYAEIPLDPQSNRTGDHWHIRVDGLPAVFCYGYRVDGPRGDGHRYDPGWILHDPYSRALSCGRPWAQAARGPGEA